MRCINCGWDNQPGAATCVKCGQLLESNDNSQQQPVVVPQQQQGGYPGANQDPLSRPTVVGIQQQPEPRPTVVGMPSEPVSRPTTVMASGQIPGGQPQPNRLPYSAAERATVSVPAEQLVENLTIMPPMANSNDGSCPSCGYPIVGSPAKCPSCGHDLSKPVQQPVAAPAVPSKQEEQPASTRVGAAVLPEQPMNGRQTVIGDFAHHLVTGEAQESKPAAAPRCSLTIVLEETEEKPELKNGYEGERIVLTRNNTEPDNRTITSREQAVLTYENGQWFIEDHSDLRSTFIRVSRKLPVQAGDVIVLGDRRFTFNEE